MPTFVCPDDAVSWTSVAVWSSQADCIPEKQPLESSRDKGSWRERSGGRITYKTRGMWHGPSQQLSKLSILLLLYLLSRYKHTHCRREISILLEWKNNLAIKLVANFSTSWKFHYNRPFPQTPYLHIFNLSSRASIINYNILLVVLFCSLASLVKYVCSIVARRLLWG